HDFDAHAGVRAHGRQADFFELIGIEIGGVRIERRDHAANRLLHELLVIDLVDVLALDALVDLGEEASLFPRKRGRRFWDIVPMLGSNVAGNSASEPEDRSRAESDQHARPHRHFLQTPPDVRWKYYRPQRPVNEIR